MREQDTDRQELARILVAVAPELRAAIRRGRRGSRALPATSDLFSSIVRRTLAARPRLWTDAKVAAPAAPSLDGAVAPTEATRVDRAEATPGPTRRGWAFLHNVIRSTIADSWRKHFASGRGSRPDMSAVAGRAAGSDADPVAVALVKERERRLIAVIAALPGPDQDLLQMRLRGCAFTMIGAAQGCSPQVARQRFLRLRRMLLVALDADVDGAGTA